MQNSIEFEVTYGLSNSLYIEEIETKRTLLSYALLILVRGIIYPASGKSSLHSGMANTTMEKYHGNYSRAKN